MTDVNPNEKAQIIFDLIGSFDQAKNKFNKNSIYNLEVKYNRSSSLIYNVWNNYKKARLNNCDDNNVFFGNNKHKSGRKLKLDDTLERSIKDINNAYKGTLSMRAMTNQLNEQGTNLALSSFHKYHRLMNGFTKTCNVKPLLKDIHRMKRLEWILQKVYLNEDDNKLYYNNEFDYIHLDEAWVKLETDYEYRKNYPNEPDHKPDHIQSKSHKTQVMDCTLVGRPIEQLNVDGKYLIQSHYDMIPAKRNSVNRDRGTLEMKPYNITADRFYDNQVKEGGVLDCITEKRSETVNDFTKYPIKIQLDNASPHTGKNNINKLNQECINRNLNIIYKLQCPNSPDLNLNDLSFNNSLSKRVHKLTFGCKKIEDLVNAVEHEFDSYDSNKLETQYGHLFACFNSILEDHGGNEYKNPHNDVRKKVKLNLPLNECCLSLDEFHSLWYEVIQFHTGFIELWEKDDVNVCDEIVINNDINELISDSSESVSNDMLTYDVETISSATPDAVTTS